jgi:hypothetical protein
MAGAVGEKSSFRRINSGTLLLEYQFIHKQLEDLYQSFTIDFDPSPSFATPVSTTTIFLGYRQ